jgi:hypothetical protein
MPRCNVALASSEKWRSEVRGGWPYAATSTARGEWALARPNLMSTTRKVFWRALRRNLAAKQGRRD